MRSQGFPPSRRLHARRDFLHVYAFGKKYFSAHFVLFARHQAGQPQRLGISASKKIGNAVARNRVKRLLREFFRLQPFCLPGMQLVVVARPGAPLLNFADVDAELGPFLARFAFPDCMKAGSGTAPGPV